MYFKKKCLMCLCYVIDLRKLKLIFYILSKHLYFKTIYIYMCINIFFKTTNEYNLNMIFNRLFRDLFF